MAINKQTSCPAAMSLFVDRNHSNGRSSSSALVLSNDATKPTRGVNSNDEGRASSHMILSFSVVVAFRTITFLLLSIALVNTFRTAVLKVSVNIDVARILFVGGLTQEFPMP
jgi:hypothetical protein